jgi:hypothetical protein
MLKYYLFFFLIFNIFIGAAISSAFYVDFSRPNNSGDGTSWATAKKDISAGINLLSAGDVLKIASGTYNEPISINTSGSVSNRILIETDDKSGNPGLVVITGSANAGSVWAGTAVYYDGCDYVTIDGRQRNGFTLNLSAGVHSRGILAENADNIVAMNITINGTCSGGTETHVVTMYDCDDMEIAYCVFNVSSFVDFLMDIGSWGGPSKPNPHSGGLIHHNEVLQATTADGYSVFRSTRHDGKSYYSNYLHDCTASGDGTRYLDNRQCHNNKYFNNVIWHKSGDRAYAIFSMRGGTSPGNSDNNEFYNNTVHVDGTLGNNLIVYQDDGAAYNKICNNLIIGSASYFLDCAGSAGSGNEIRNNIVTGNIGTWVAGVCGGGYTVGDNQDNQGTAYLYLSGAKPSPFWDLQSNPNFNGYYPGSPPVDFNGHQRGNPPDVGAFEYGGSVNYPPGKPTGLIVSP